MDEVTQPKRLLVQPWPLMEEAMRKRKRFTFIGWPALLVLVGVAFLPEWRLKDAAMTISFALFAWACLRERFYNGVIVTLREHRSAIRTRELQELRNGTTE